MANSASLYPITNQAGIKRDGTRFSGNYYIDGSWCRFQRGLPRKMGGYFQVNGALPHPPRGTYVVPNTPNFDIYVPDQATISFQKIDQFNNPIGGLVNRSPAGFAPTADYVYQFAQMYITTNNTSNIIVHGAPNLTQIDNIVETPGYYGDIAAVTPLVPTGVSVSGGITAMNPYLVYYGNFGDVKISNANNPTTIMFENRVCSQKIIAGTTLRGTSNGPACLLWSLDAVIRIVATGNPAVPFAFYTVTSENSILSSRSVVEYDGIFYWAGIDRFLFYNGTVQELPNQMNLDFFFQQLNYAQRQKVWATKIPEFGEIHWHFPTGASLECNHIVIYNKRENCWFDTPYPASVNYPAFAQGRGAGYFEQVFADPIWCDNMPNNGGTYSIWVHEVAYDENDGGLLYPISSFFTTGDIAWTAISPMGQWTGVDRWIDLERMEPDFWMQNGNMTLTITGYEYANSPALPDGLYNPYTFGPLTNKVDMREQARYMTLTFTSNVLGGFYELGQVLLWFRIGDARP